VTANTNNAIKFFRTMLPLGYRIVKNMINNSTKHTWCKIPKQSKMV